MSGKNPDSGILDDLFTVIRGRRGHDPESSYTAKLLARGRGEIACKLGEEATETIVAALDQTDRDVIAESADLLYHLLVLWAEMEIDPADVWAELRRRQGVSGIEEKNARPKK